MANFYSHNIGVRIVLCVSACNFLFCSLPLSGQVHYEKAVSLSDLAFVARMQSLIKKANKYAERQDQGKLLAVIMEIKMEVEAYTGKTIDLDQALNEIENNAKQNGARIRTDEMNKIRSLIHKSEKRKYHKALYLMDCNMNAIDYHESKYQEITKSAHKEVNNKKEEDVPVRVTIGVTAALAGYFLSFVPHPLVQTASRILIATGSGLCVEGTINRLEENKKAK